MMNNKYYTKNYKKNIIYNHKVYKQLKNKILK